MATKADLSAALFTAFVNGIIIYKEHEAGGSKVKTWTFLETYNQPNGETKLHGVGGYGSAYFGYKQQTLLEFIHTPELWKVSDINVADFNKYAGARTFASWFENELKKRESEEDDGYVHYETKDKW